VVESEKEEMASSLMFLFSLVAIFTFIAVHGQKG
jgi:hypothetical protein